MRFARLLGYNFKTGETGLPDSGGWESATWCQELPVTLVIPFGYVHGHPQIYLGTFVD
jgi:hypothetical protein